MDDQSSRSMGFNDAVLLIGQILLAILGIAVSTLVFYFIRRYLSASNIALLFFLPVGISSALWGLVPGIVSATCAFLALNYFFLLPYYSFHVHRTEDLLVLLTFLVVAVVINTLVGRTKASLAEATARERETALLYELSLALAGLNDDRAIANTLVEKIQITFRASCAQVSIQTASGEPPILITSPLQSEAHQQEKALLIPLQTARGLLGEICLWRDEPPLTPQEERLLRTFASQGALALERANLAQASRRARILEESDRLKSALLSSVSHELRTPLATIKASVSSLTSDEVQLDPEARKELLQAIEEETDHLNQLVGNLLDMSRIESGAVKPLKKWNVFAEITNRAIKQMKPVVQRHQIINEVSYDLPLVPVDYVQMERVLTNLLSNSIKYSPDNTTITLRAKVNDDQNLWVQVANQGPHVPEGDLKKIFEKFYRVTAADQITSTGLGLSICKGFVEAHGGKIWAENLPGGFAFNFTLPLTWEGVTPHLPEIL